MISTADQRRLRRFAPIVEWLPGYRRSWLRGDTVAGLTVWALVVPESMAYAGVAGVPVQFGLYSVILAGIGYAVFGSCREMVIGPSSTVAALSAVVVAPLAAAGGDEYIALTAALAAMVGVLYLIGGLIRMGFVANFFAKPVLDGFIAGLGLYILVGQLPKLVDIDNPGGNTVTEAARVVGDVGDWSVFATVIGVVALVVLFGLERFAPRLPGALIVAALAIVAVPLFDLTSHGIATVGHIPTGFTSISWSKVSFDDLRDMLPGAAGIVVVGFAQSVAIAKAYGVKKHYRPDPSQEMIGYGAANVGAAALGGFTVTGSLTKCAAAESAGGRTPLVSLIVSVATLLTVVALAGAFENLPEPVLAAIVIHAVTGMVDFAPMARLWRARTIDLWLALAAFAGVVLIGILPGIGIGILLSLMLFQHRIDRPHSARLGLRPDGQTYGDVQDRPDYEIDPTVLVYRWDAPLIFANADHFIDDLTRHIDDDASAVGAVVVDCEAVFDVDTTGAGALASVQSTLAAEHVELHLARVHEHVRDFLRRAGTADEIGADRLHDTIREAVDASRPPESGNDPASTGDELSETDHGPNH